MQAVEENEEYFGIVSNIKWLGREYTFFWNKTRLVVIQHFKNPPKKATLDELIAKSFGSFSLPYSEIKHLVLSNLNSLWRSPRLDIITNDETLDFYLNKEQVEKTINAVHQISELDGKSNF